MSRPCEPRPGSQAQALLREIAAAEQRLAELQGQLAAVREKARAAIPDYTGQPWSPPKERQRQGGCTHGVIADFVVAGAIGTTDGRRVYRCSSCGAQDTWEPGWCFYGTYECERCGWAVVERVHCRACSTGTTDTATRGADDR